MLLYHFTSHDLAQKIDREGITIGGVYTPSQNAVYKGFIWLTDDPRFEAQNWATNYTGMVGDRTEVRYTVEVEKPIPWNLAARAIFGLSKDELIEYNLAGHSDGSHWYLYKGVIPVSSIIQKTPRMG